jgi:hypothetical protein
MVGRREKRAPGGFAERLREIIDAYGSANAIARAIERSEGAVRKWLRGQSEPNVSDLRSLCEKTHTRIEWLVTGRGARAAPALGVQETPPPYENTPCELSYTLLEAILTAVEEQLLGTRVELPPAKKAMVVVTLYDLCHERKEVDREAVVRLVKLAG